LVSWLSSSRTELVETLNSFANSRRYDRVFGLKKKRVRSLMRVLDDMSPVNKFSMVKKVVPVRPLCRFAHNLIPADQKHIILTCPAF